MGHQLEAKGITALLLAVLDARQTIPSAESNDADVSASKAEAVTDSIKEGQSTGGPPSRQLVFLDDMMEREGPNPVQPAAV